MSAFLFRLSALAVRFLCPLVALALSSPETMGKYYLFISYFTFVVGVSALELAVPFSRKYLRCRGDKQRRLVFAGFMTNQMVVTTALAIPAGMLVASWAGVPAILIPMFCLSLATEACVNEVGRFFWNIVAGPDSSLHLHFGDRWLCLPRGRGPHRCDVHDHLGRKHLHHGLGVEGMGQQQSAYAAKARSLAEGRTDTCESVASRFASAVCAHAASGLATSARAYASG
jgi:hypothetical protein